jgi:tRNA nucleotidyltransferase (CCA-adding enzyme)
LDIINRTGLYNTIFADLSKIVRQTPDLSWWTSALQVTQAFVTASKTSTVSADTDATALSNLRTILLRNDEDLYMLWLLTSLAPWSGSPILQKGKPVAPAAMIARQGLKISNRYFDIITQTFQHLPQLFNLATVSELDKLGPVGESSESANRGKLGIALRTWGATWRSQISFAFILEAARSCPPLRESFFLFLLILHYVPS